MKLILVHQNQQKENLKWIIDERMSKNSNLIKMYFYLTIFLLDTPMNRIKMMVLYTHMFEQAHHHWIKKLQIIVEQLLQPNYRIWIWVKRKKNHQVMKHIVRVIMRIIILSPVLVRISISMINHSIYRL
jgi:hypothetical protein